MSIRTLSRRNVKAIGDADVKLKDGKAVLIRDVATVEDGGSPATQDVTIDSTSGVYLNVLRVPGGNTLAIVDQAKAIVKSIQAKLPPGCMSKRFLTSLRSFAPLTMD